MTLTTKIIILANCLLLTGCFGPDWNRIRSAQDVAILGMNHASSLTHFDSNGSIHLEKKHQRIDAFKSTHKQLKSFEFLIVPVLNKALRSTSFSVETRRIKPNIDLKNNTYASQLVQKNNVDLGINMTHQFGVIAIPTPPDMRQQYRLALKATIQFADKQGFIGQKSYFIPSSHIKLGGRSIPPFQRNDFKSIERIFIDQLTDDIQWLKDQIPKRTHHNH